MEMTITEYRNFQKLEKQRLMRFTKGELVEELLAVYEHYRKRQNTSSNSKSTQGCAICGCNISLRGYCAGCQTRVD